MSASEPGAATARIPRARPFGLRGVDVAGVALFVALIGWTLLVGAVTGRDAAPMALLLTATGVSAFVARGLTRRSNLAVPLLVLVPLVGAIVVSWPEAIHPHFGLVGYSNANGALYVVGAGAAGLLVLRSRVWPLRLGAGAVGIALAALPWVFDSAAAAVSGLFVIAIIVVLLLARSGPSRWVLPVGAAIALVALLGTVIAGVAYSGDGEGDGAWRLTERRLVLWSEAAELLAAEPLVGVGPGGFAELSPTARDDRDARWAHHAPLQVGAETGIVGLGLLLALLGWAFVWLRRGSGRRGGALAAVVLGLGIAHATIDFVWHYPAVTVALAAVVGAGSTARRRTQL